MKPPIRIIEAIEQYEKLTKLEPENALMVHRSWVIYFKEWIVR